MLHGNILNSIKIGTWNKGPSLYKNSIQNIAKVITEHKLDILSLQELNLRSDNNINTLKIPNYTLVHDSLMDKTGLSRAGLLINESINYKVRKDLSCHQEAHVVITLYLTKNKKK